nr:type II secretion system protein [uncultured Campylobacter sp.]
MKKGFTMIELIFVIVILGILASVAIPRLAATREDAEISAAVANLRTLVSDASAYYVAKKDGFGNAKWSEITNVPLATTGTDTTAKAVGTAATAKLKVGGKDCIGVHLVENATPAHIVFTKENNGGSVCTQVQSAEPLKAYLDSKIQGDNTAGKIAIGSTTSVYTKPSTNSNQQPKKN